MGDRRVKPERRKAHRPNTKERRISVERRRQKRFVVREGAFAALIDGNNRLGQIRDISLVGLSFRYIDTEERIRPDSVLKIILAGRGLLMDDLPFTPVSDFEVENDHAFSLLRIRQMHLAFGDLTDQQLSQLDQFILNHTMGEA
jgi:hypothetical protein